MGHRPLGSNWFRPEKVKATSSFACQLLTQGNLSKVINTPLKEVLPELGFVAELGQGTGGSKLETGNLGQESGDRELGAGNWGAGNWGQQTGQGTGAGSWDRELAGTWGQQTGDRELGTGNWGQGTGTGDRELGAGNWATLLRRRERVLLLAQVEPWAGGGGMLDARVGL